MSNQMAAIRNMMEYIPRPWPVAQRPSQLASQRTSVAYVSPNPSVTDILYSAQHHVPLASQQERSLRGIFSAGMLALQGLFAKGGQKIRRGMNRGLQRNIYPRTRVPVEVGRLTLSPSIETGTEPIEGENVVAGEILDETHSLSNFVGSHIAKSPVSPAFEETIVATWARVAQESRALGMPMKEDVVGYLKTQTHLWDGDDAETSGIIDTYIDRLDPEKHAAYGTMPKDVGYAWAHSTLLYRTGEDGDATEQFIREEMKKWGWNDAAAAVVFGEIAQEKITKEASNEPGLNRTKINVQESRPPITPVPTWKHSSGQSRAQSPGQVAATSIRGGGDSGTTPPKKTEEPEGWRKWLPLGVAGAVVLSVFGVVLGWDTASRSPGTTSPVPTASASTPGTQDSGEETPEGSTDDNDNEQNPEQSKYSDETKQMVNVRQTDDGRLFVDATRWKPRRTTTYPTYWNLAGEQIQANEGREPTMHEYIFVKNALLRVNHETEASARRMPVGHDMFLLTQAQYAAAMEKAHA